METETETEAGTAAEESKILVNKMRMSMHSVVGEMITSRRAHTHRRHSTFSAFLCCGRNFDSEDESENERPLNMKPIRYEQHCMAISAAESNVSRETSTGDDRGSSYQSIRPRGRSKQASSVPTISRSDSVPNRNSEKRSKSQALMPIGRHEVLQHFASAAAKTQKDSSSEEEEEDEEEIETKDNFENTTPEPSDNHKENAGQGNGVDRVSKVLHNGKKSYSSGGKGRFSAKEISEKNKQKLSTNKKFLQHLNKMIKECSKCSESGWLPISSSSTSMSASSSKEDSDSSSNYAESNVNDESRKTSSSTSETSSKSKVKERRSRKSTPAKHQKKFRRRKLGKSKQKRKKKRKASFNKSLRTHRSRQRKEVRKTPRRTLKRKGKLRRYSVISSRWSKVGSKTCSITRLTTRPSKHQVPVELTGYHLEAVKSHHGFKDTCYIPHGGISFYRHGGRRCRSTTRRGPDRSSGDRYSYVAAAAAAGRSRVRAASSAHRKAGWRRKEARPDWDNRF